MAKKPLTSRQLVRLSKKAENLFSCSTVLAGCLPAEFGTTVAADFTDSAIEEGVRALEKLVTIKIALRLQGNTRRRTALTLTLDMLNECARCFLGRGAAPDPVRLSKAISVVQQALEEEPRLLKGGAA